MDLKELYNTSFIRHPWEKARLSFFRRVLIRYIKNQKAPIKILDIGSGDGYFAKGIFSTIDNNGYLTCWDTAFQDEFLRNNEQNQQIFFTKDKPQEKFDLFLLMDVLEHIENEVTFMQRIVEDNTQKNAIFLISVPAWRKLYSAHDKKLGHIRRYSAVQLKDVLERSGLEILQRGGMFYSLLLPRFFQKTKESIAQRYLYKNLSTQHLPDLGNWNRGKIMSKTVESFLLMDNFISYLVSFTGLSLPGLSFWAVCKKA